MKKVYVLYGEKHLEEQDWDYSQPLGVFAKAKDAVKEALRLTQFETSKVALLQELEKSGSTLAFYEDGRMLWIEAFEVK